MDPLLARLRRLTAKRDCDGEGALLARYAVTGDPAAVEELVRRHGPLVWAAARRRLPDPDDAADVFQATFLVLLRRAAGLNPAAPIGPWLYRVASLTARNLRRKNARRLARRRPLLDVAAAPGHELRADLDDALLTLPERDPAAVVLCHLQGYSRQEAAERLGLPEGTLSSRLNRALAKLRRRLGDDPLPLLVVGTAVPASVATAAVRTAAVVRVASLAAAGSQVAQLTTETLRMFWPRKLVAGGLTALACLGLGLGVGLTPQPAAVAADPPKSDAPASEPPKAASPTILPLERGDTVLKVYTANADDAGRGLYQYRIQEEVMFGPSFDYGVSSSGPSLQQYLKRAAARPDQPKRVYLFAAGRERTPERIRQAVRALMAAGFDTVLYTGPIPGRWDDGKLADGQSSVTWRDITTVDQKPVNLQTTFPAPTARWDPNHPLTYELYEGGSLLGVYPWRPGLTVRTAALAAPSLKDRVDGASAIIHRYPLDAIGNMASLRTGGRGAGRDYTLDTLEVRPDDQVFLTPAKK